MQELKLILAGESDIPLISRLAEKIWNQHYPSIIGQAQVDYMLARMYSAAGLQEQLTAKKHVFYLIHSNREPVGFISVSEERKGEWFLNKFYVDQNVAAKGIGTRTFSNLLELIRPVKLTLTVNRGNFKSINFYFKVGFRITNMTTIDIGNGFVMDDFVMEWREGSV
jgi:diamine N-acetyltransferase